MNSFQSHLESGTIIIGLSKFWIKANQAYNRGKIFNMLTMVKE
jgi:hypothetical protein